MLSRSAFLALCLAAAAAEFLSGCGKPARAAEPGRHYYDGTFDSFSIKFPSKWDRQRGSGIVKIMALSPITGERDTFRENINVGIEGTGWFTGIDKYVEKSIAEAKKQLRNLKVNSQGETTVDGKPARWIIFDHQFGPYQLRALTYAVFDGRTAFIITCTSTSKTFSKYKSTFEKAVQSFRVE
jgi:hypothetical protein